ncbi:TPA: Membrane steroid-binding protein 1 [Trebouxia sp. C0006]
MPDRPTPACALLFPKLLCSPPPLRPLTWESIAPRAWGKSATSERQLRLCAEPEWVEPDIPPDQGSIMPLHLAVAEGYADIVGVLLTNGADPYACRTVMDDMPMWYAVNGGGDAVLKVVLSHGVDINAKNSRGDTCLLTAAIFVNNEAAEVLLAHGADPNIGNGWTALHHAACDENEDLCKLLILWCRQDS